MADSESVNLRPLLGDAQALVVVVDSQGRAGMYPVPPAQADTLRAQLGQPSWDTEGEHSVITLLRTIARIARVRIKISEDRS
jgi:hypothetical protein